MFIFAHLNFYQLAFEPVIATSRRSLAPKSWSLVLCWAVHMYKYCLVAKVTWLLGFSFNRMEWKPVCFCCSAHAQSAGHLGFKLLGVAQNLYIVARIQLTVMWVLYFPFSGQGAFGIIWGAQGLQFSERQCYWPLKGLCLLWICGSHNYRCGKL